MPTAIIQERIHDLTVTVASGQYHRLVALVDAQNGWQWAARIQGQNITWRVVADGFCGLDVLADGVIPAGDAQTVRVVLPSTPIAAAQLRVEVAVTSGASAGSVRAEVQWLPIEPGAQVLRGGTARPE